MIKTHSGVTAALGSVFLILIVCVFPIQRPQGLMTKIGIKRSDCGDMSRTIVVHVGKSGQASLNGEAIKAGQLESRLHAIFSLRAERLLFLSADPDVAFADVAPVVDLAQGQVDYVALLTPKVQKAPGSCLTIGMPPTLDYSVPPRPAPHIKEIPIWQIWRR
jgi:biopolymer transport protein ExbD